jgi:hypothetical protein
MISLAPTTRYRPFAATDAHEHTSSEQALWYIGRRVTTDTHGPTHVCVACETDVWIQPSDRGLAVLADRITCEHCGTTPRHAPDSSSHVNLHPALSPCAR